MSHTLALAMSPCPNDIYIFAGLLLGKSDPHGLHFEPVFFEDIESLNERAVRGETDVLKISYANYPRIAHGYELLRCGGALGRGVGPLLLVNGEAERFDPRQEILVPGEWTTANFLLDYYLGETGHGDVSKRFVPFDRLYAELCNRNGAQGVVIHEKRFTYERDGLTLVQDLGEYWEGQTGHAIPLGAISVRRALGAQTIAAVTAAVGESIAWSDAHPEEAFALCRHYAQDLTDGVIQSHIHLYVNDFSRDLGAEGQAAVEFFLSAARRRQKR